jgi:hypothetical protein
LFFNPAMQGLARFFRSWVRVYQRAAEGKTVSEKVVRLLTARTVVMAGLAAGAAIVARMLKSDDDEEEWRQQSASIRDFHSILSLPGFGNIAIPRPYDWGYLMAGGERLADWVIAKQRGDEVAARRAFEGYAGSALGAFLPINDVASLMGGFAPLIEAQTNYDMFRQRSIIPQWEVGKDLALRDTSRASALGQALQGYLNTDARILDHVIEGYAGNWGRMLTSSGRPADWWVGSVTGLMKSDPAGGARDVQWVYDHAASKGWGMRDEVKRMTGLLKRARDTEVSLAERERRAEVARRYAERLRRGWER